MMPSAWEDVKKWEFLFVVGGNERAIFSFLENNQLISTKKKKKIT